MKSSLGVLGPVFFAILLKIMPLPFSTKVNIVLETPGLRLDTVYLLGVFGSFFSLSQQ